MKISINNTNSKSYAFVHSPVRAFEPSFRFRRWSRAGYAVFRSLSICVTIGQLNSDICEKAFYKLKGISQKILAFVLLENDIAEENTEPDELIKQNQLEQLLFNYSVNSTAAASVVVAVFSLFGGWNKNFLFQPLFFKPLQTSPKGRLWESAKDNGM